MVWPAPLAAFWLGWSGVTAIWLNRSEPVVRMQAALCGSLVARAMLLCCGLRLGVQREEAHHVACDRKPQQMDAGLDLAAQR